MRNWLLNLMARYLAWCARHVLSRAPVTVQLIGISGSSGKTSTKEMMGLLFKEQVGSGVVISSGNLNNEIGLPLTILGYKKVPNALGYIVIFFQAFWRSLTTVPASVYVLEYGIDKPGDMDTLTSIARPTTAVLTNISSVHLEYFQSIDELTNEKMKLAKAVKTDGLVLLNGDDKNLISKIPHIDSDVKKYGHSKDCDLILKSINTDINETSFTVEYEGKTSSYSISALGEQHVMSVLPAVIYGKIKNYPEDVIKSALLRYDPLPGRGNIVDGKKNTTIINETYNANPLSTRLALEVLGKIKRSPRIAVLGDMLELGDASAKEHENILDIAQKNADVVITVGPRFKVAGEGNKNFSNSDEAAKYLLGNIKQGAIILVKGSQGIRTEKIVEKIMEKPERAEELLPRQSREWKKIVNS